jgi:hypothetical protein
MSDYFSIGMRRDSAPMGGRRNPPAVAAARHL